MSSRPAQSLSGLIERVTFHNEENGWAALKVKDKGHRDLVSVVGSLASVSAGEWVTTEGRWVQDPEFGLEFRADLLNSPVPLKQLQVLMFPGESPVSFSGISPIDINPTGAIQSYQWITTFDGGKPNGPRNGSTSYATRTESESGPSGVHGLTFVASSLAEAVVLTDNGTEAHSREAHTAGGRPAKRAWVASSAARS
jgi:hypothetical protein